MLAYSQGKYADAAKQLEAAVSASPTLADAYTGLGLTRESQGRREQAIAAYQQALELEPDNFSARMGLVRLGVLTSPSPGASESQGVTP
jgi:superkiller protein 3